MNSTKPDTESTREPPRPSSAVVHTSDDGTLAMETKGEKTSPTVDESMILTGRKLVFAQIGFLLTGFCFALDQTIVATALPKLASEFNALDKLTWVVSVYLLCTAGLMLIFGPILRIAVAKYVYMVCITVFEVGSLICATAPSINVLIFGRAIQGLGGAGMFTAVLTIFAQVTKLETRPLLMGSFGAVFGLSSVLGPLLGGAFTDHLTWRWCFYINLPIGAISLVVAIFVQPANPPPGIESDTRPFLTKLIRLDWIGGLLSFATVVCLLLPLQWGGVTRPWNDKVIIILFVIFAVLFGVFIAWEFRMGEKAMLPLSLFTNRSLDGAALGTILSRIAFLSANYFLPFFYQAKGRSASQSGIAIIPFMLSIVLTSIIASIIVKRTGHYYVIMVAGPLVASIGVGLLIMINEYTKSSTLIGYQILMGVGLGSTLQLPNLAVQAEFADRPKIVPQAMALVMFFQMLGGAIGIAIAGAVFNNQLSKNIPKYAPNLSSDLIRQVKQSVIVIFQLEPAQRDAVVHAYVKSLDYVFVVGVPACILSAVAFAFIRNWNLKTRQQEIEGEKKAPVP